MSALSIFARRFRLLAALCLLPWLSACWVSNEPLIGTATASHVDFASTYKPEGYEVVVRSVHKEDGSYELTDGKDGFTGFYRRIAPDWYLVQLDFQDFARDIEQGGGAGGSFKVEVPEGEGPWFYNLVHLDGQGLEFYRVACDDKARAIDGVSAEKAFDEKLDACVFASLEQVEAAAMAAKQTIESGAFVGEKRVMRAIE